jgi:hypothetical protein
VNEYNALCAGTHPLFANEPKVVMDGTDGSTDMRIDMAPGGGGCGTWVRTADGALSLVLGTIEQPPMQQAGDLEGFYQASELVVEIVDGAGPAAARLKDMLGGRGRTLALRDYYPGEKAHIIQIFKYIQSTLSLTLLHSSHTRVVRSPSLRMFSSKSNHSPSARLYRMGGQRVPSRRR